VPDEEALAVVIGVDEPAAISTVEAASDFGPLSNSSHRPCRLDGRADGVLAIIKSQLSATFNLQLSTLI
jgi:hypothetical protein